MPKLPSAFKKCRPVKFAVLCSLDRAIIESDRVRFDPKLLVKNEKFKAAARKVKWAQALLVEAQDLIKQLD